MPFVEIEDGGGRLYGIQMRPERRLMQIKIDAGELSHAGWESKLVIEKAQQVIDAMGIDLTLRVGDYRRWLEGYVVVEVESPMPDQVERARAMAQLVEAPRDVLDLPLDGGAQRVLKAGSRQAVHLKRAIARLDGDPSYPHDAI